MTQDPEDGSPAGPDRIQQFNSARLVIVSGLLVVGGAWFLITALISGRNALIPTIILGLGIVALLFAVPFARRYWVVRANGKTLDEDDPKRTPEQQWRRDERVRRHNSRLTPRQQAVLGALALTAGTATIIVAAVLGHAGAPNWLYWEVALPLFGVTLLIRAAVHRRSATKS